MSTAPQLDTDTLRILEKRRYQAMIDGDVETLDSLLSDKAIYTHSNGARDTKQTYLAKVADGLFRFLRIEHSIDQIVVANNCALVVGSMRATVILAGVEKELNNAALAVWTRDADGRWRLLGYQPTVLPSD
jgi:ketosteroid isomerase-like protein